MVDRKGYGPGNAVMDESRRSPYFVKPLECAGPHGRIVRQFPGREDDVVACGEASRVAGFDCATGRIDFIAIQEEHTYSRQQLLSRGNGEFVAHGFCRWFMPVNVVNSALTSNFQ